MASTQTIAGAEIDVSSSLRSLILAQFEPTIASQLIEFGKFISALDADILIFMARKSLCLYDLLIAIGIPQTERVVLSDRALDLDTQPLIGKRIALIDDTLIVGTTLAKTRDFLSAIPNCSVTIHVFCVDIEWHRDQIVKPDTVFLRADDRTVMNFCAALVRAMSLLPRPYLVDFPITSPFRVRSGDLQCFLSATSWRSFRLSSTLQARNGVEAYTFLPEPEIHNIFLDSIDPSIRSCVEISKVRAFGRSHQDIFWFKLIPIVTVGPLHNFNISRLLDGLLSRLQQRTESVQLANSLSSPQARHRFFQFLLSAALGKAFYNHVSSSIGSTLRIEFDQSDIERHYGPWLRNAVLTCTASAEQILAGPFPNNDNSAVSLATIPNRVGALANEVVRSAEPKVQVPEGYEFKRNLAADCATLFVEMYRIREVPAREEAVRLGPAVTSASAEEAPYRDRLNIGIPWRSIAKYLRRTSGVPIPGRYEDTMSLALDICNDLGIVVPITSTCDGVTFRAYRYGEDAPFGDSELRLAYESVRGFLQASQRDTIPHLTLEKLLVFLLRAGVATNFLRPFYGQSGTDGTARVGFGLKGAVVILSRGPRDRSDRDIWLTHHLRERGVVDFGARGLYQLGNAPASDGNTRLALTNARQTGIMLGRCIKAKDDAHRDAPLDDRSLILLMTCCTPRDAAASLQVELCIFRDWYRATRDSWSRRVKWDDPASLRNTLDAFVQSAGYEAMHSGHLKYSGFIDKKVPELIGACSEFLNQESDHGLLRDAWDATWHMISLMQTPQEETVFNQCITECAELIMGMGIAMTVIELAFEVAILSHSRGSESRVRRTAQKLETFYSASQSLKRTPSYLLKLGSISEMTTDTILKLKFDEIVPVCLKHIDTTLDRVDFLVEKMEPLIEEYGRLRGMHKYRYFLYYDIIDSTATKAARAGGNSEDHEERVQTLKLAINRSLEQLAIIARKNRGEVYCTNGDLDSDNDCKHIFFSGKMSRRYLEECMRRLFELTLSVPGVHLRIYVLPCNFVGSDAYRFHSGTEVKGPRFWTNWSRILKSGKPLEDAVGTSTSFLLIGDTNLQKEIELSFADWSDTSEIALETELAGAFRKIPVRYGPLKAR